ncbi:MAG: lytic transglycosylase domain-containing protein [Clostridiales bacterium]|nr:lytic transglycosylase domain-containing protein [Clostridiales bacterium]
MSNYPAPQFEPHRPAPAQRNRRAGRRHARRSGMPLWQVLVLCSLALGVALSAFSFARGAAQLGDLRAERQRAQEEYQTMVNRHIVKYRDLITYWSAVYDLNPAYVAAVIYRESHYDPDAVSRVGARGLMQLMPDTGSWMAEKAGLKDYTDDALFDPETNIRLGCRYLNYLSGKFDGDPILVACSYHAGAGNVQSWLNKYSSDGKTLTLSEIPTDDTRPYAEKVVTSYAVYLQHFYPDGGAGADAASVSVLSGAGVLR